MEQQQASVTKEAAVKSSKLERGPGPGRHIRPPTGPVHRYMRKCVGCTDRLKCGWRVCSYQPPR